MTYVLDSIEACSEIASDVQEDSLLDSEGWRNLMDEVPWTLGCGCSYYQKELFAELFCPCEAWLAD